MYYAYWGCPMLDCCRHGDYMKTTHFDCHAMEEEKAPGPCIALPVRFAEEWTQLIEIGALQRRSRGGARRDHSLDLESSYWWGIDPGSWTNPACHHP